MIRKKSEQLEPFYVLQAGFLRNHNKTAVVDSPRGAGSPTYGVWDEDNGIAGRREELGPQWMGAALRSPPDGCLSMGGGLDL